MPAAAERFRPLSTRLDPAESEGRVLALWKEIRAFEDGLKRREGQPPFIFYEGPPTANGLPGVHHVISRTLKDIVCRYQSMTGHYVPRKGGWDTHGLPVEIEVERELKISGKEQIETFGIAEFNARCRASVLRYEAEWRRNTERIGYWLDMDHPYVTFHNEYIESVWWLLQQIWDANLLYQGHKIVPYCPRCGTPLSSHEVAQGFDDVTEPSVTVKFALVDEPDTYVLAWTTTPWTLPGNVALAVNPDIAYVLVRQERDGRAERYYLAESRLEQLEGAYAVERRLRGHELQGKRYRPLFDFIDLAKLTGKDAYYVAEAPFVTTEDGTGVVHTAVMYGEDDYQLGLKLELPQHHTVDPQGRFTAEVTPWAGRFVKDAEAEIRAWLSSRGLLYREEMTTHAYPFCWRCDSPLLYYAWKTWYIATTRLREKMLEAHRTVAWHPEEIGKNRFGNWIENNVDWALSRNRFWGTPLPIWRCEGCGSDRCVGSVAELRQGKGLPEPLDLHRPYVDHVTFACSGCGGVMRRVPEVIDVWFDSGSMPFAQWHYPFENKEAFRVSYPADFISEGVDQTRGWFYTLLAISVAVTGKAPYRHVLVNELVLDKLGKKMSKSRGNAVDPNEVLELRGADALRFYLIANSQPWSSTRFDVEGVTETAKKLLGTLRNTAQFFVLYANIDGFDPSEKEPVSPSAMDRWILSRLQATILACRASLDGYELTRGARAIQEFVVEELSNWYVRRSRRRFWKSGDPADKRAAYETLFTCLETVSRLLAPYAPFITEELHQHLVRPADPEAPKSVHWTDYPVADAALVDETLERAMSLAERVVVLGRAARNLASLRVRQPLRRIAVAGLAEGEQRALLSLADVIQEELNVKELAFAKDRSELLTTAVKPNFPVLGKKAGPAMKSLAAAIQAAPIDTARRALSAEGWEIEAEGQVFRLTAEDVQVQESPRAPWAAQSEGSLTVAVDTTLDDALRDEGLVRELAHRVQALRKSAEFEVTDRIRLYGELSPGLKRAFERHEETFKDEVLAVELVPGAAGGEAAESWTFDGEQARVGIERVPKGG
ncbi:MAG TPA: isoleucine--tRNA ligase [Candidatus Eisenbacteria bacterium]|nr:isoleucine--tRNA ligase [Candidatus Eisenbacteria bacterium]